MHSTTQPEFARLMVVAARYLWLRQRRGIFTEIALDLDVTPSAIHLVYWGKRTSARIAEALRAHGAPGFEEEAVNGRRGKKKRSSRKDHPIK